MKLSQVGPLYQQFHLFQHIKLHCIKVAAVSRAIAKKITSNQTDINIDITNLTCAALLHDIFKVCDFKSFDEELLRHEFDASDQDILVWKKIRQQFQNIGHWDAAHQYFEANGESEVASMIQTHDMVGINSPASAPKTIEQKILYYADKRVAHDQITSLKKRIEEGLSRYFKDGPIPKDIQISIRHCESLEEELFTLANCHPSDISEKSTAKITAFLQEIVD